MKFLLSGLLLFIMVVINYANHSLNVQYFRRPIEYAYFKTVDIETGNEWSTYVYMNKSANIREDAILKLIQPLYDGPPRTLRFESASITRHIGKQFEYILTKWNFDSMTFENLCSQMKPKFSILLQQTTQQPAKIAFVVEHPSSSFTIPEGFRKSVGREEFRLTVGGRALLNPENFDFESVIHTKRLIVKQGTEFRNGLVSEKIVKLRGEEVLLEGLNYISIGVLKEFAKEWILKKREVKHWEVHLDESDQNEQWYFERDGLTLDIGIHGNRLHIITYPIPGNRTYFVTEIDKLRK